MKRPIGEIGSKAVTALGVTSMLALTAIASPVANADAMLFPVMTRSPSVATIVSVVNKDPQGVVNLNYFTKSPDLATPCLDEGVKQVAASGRANDMVTFDAAGVFLASEGSGPLFNDPQTLAPYGSVQFSTANTGVARGFLIVDDGDNSSAFGGADLYGEAIMLEISGGAAFGYRALNTSLSLAPSPVFAIIFA